MADLAELTRVAQIALEAHRFDPDDVSWADFEKARDERDTAWLEHADRIEALRR